MKSLLFIATATILFIPGFHAQNSGLYGKKTYIEINGLGYSPMFSNVFNKQNEYSYRSFKVENGSLVEKKDRFNYGFRVAIGRVLTRSFAIGLEAGFDYSNLKTPYLFEQYDGNWNYESFFIKHENLDVKSTQIMPKLEFTKEGGLLPIGLNHQLGFGFNTFQIVEREYKHTVIDGSSILTPEEKASIGSRFVNFDQRYKGYTIMYAFNIRTPVSKSLLINYGIRYTLNIRNPSPIAPDKTTFWYPSSNLNRDLGRDQVLHFLTFNIGATFAF
jgi:hypothetical protein